MVIAIQALHGITLCFNPLLLCIVLLVSFTLHFIELSWFLYVWFVWCIIELEHGHIIDFEVVYTYFWVYVAIGFTSLQGIGERIS